MLSPFPTHAHLYLVAAGIVAGLLLSPAVLGRALPETHADWFGGTTTQELEAALLAHDAETAAGIERIKDTGVTKDYVEEYLAERRAKKAEILRQPTDSAVLRVAPMSTAIVLALAAVMLLEALVAPQPGGGNRTVVSAAVGRLVTVRFALLAAWIALTLAQPATLYSFPVLFGGLLILVALVAGLIPLGPGRARADETE